MLPVNMNCRSRTGFFTYIQCLIFVLFSALIPLLFCLGLMINRVTPPAEITVFSTQLLLVNSPKLPSLESEISKVNRLSRIQLVAAKSLPHPMSEKQYSPALPIPLPVDSGAFEEVQADLIAPTQHYRGKAAFSAYQDSRSEIEKMADRKGWQLLEQRPTKYDDFQVAAEHAVIPACLEKDTSSKLGLDSLKGLLVVPALALSAIRGKCK